MALFTTDEQTALKAPHVGRAFFVELEFPDGIRRYHNSFGTLTMALNGVDYEWTGMSDPFGGAMVGVSEIEDPRFGSAPTIEISLAGINAAYMRSVKDIARDIEGRTANVYFAMVDPEEPNNDGIVVGLKPLFPLGRMTAPKLRRSATMNVITLTVETFFQSQNYPFGGMWSDSGQQRRYAGDRGLENMGTVVGATRR